MEQPRVAFETARLRLARYRVEGEQARNQGAAYATQVSAETLEIERVGVWMFKERGRRLVCASQYCRSRREHSSGQVLLSDQYPKYMDALKQRRVIVAQDARNHPLTGELKDGYLDPAGIASLLDAPIIRHGRVVGVVCHEHIGEPRVFSEKELAFASSVADMVTLIFEQADRLELEAALQQQAEQRLEQQKMEALGRMARAVAHDFNNLLHTMSMTFELLLESAPPELRKTASDVVPMIQVGERLTQQLLAFGSTRNDGPRTTANLGELVERMTPMVRTAAGKQIDVQTAVETNDTTVAIDPSHLEQVLLNLCLNARDAIDDKGEIKITVREPLDSDDVAPDFVVLEVRDTGAGMNEATSARIFEPFFTTKPAGTGLGLATVYGIVQRSHGMVRVASEPGKGTTMRVALPRTTSA